MAEPPSNNACRPSRASKTKRAENGGDEARCERKRQKKEKRRIEAQSAAAADALSTCEADKGIVLVDGARAAAVEPKAKKGRREGETKRERRLRREAKRARKGEARGARRRTDAPSVGPVPPRLPLPLHQLVMAPMVGGSDLPFRLLSRRYGTQLAYTPMMYSAKFAADVAYRNTEMQTCAEDAPLVAHFCGNDPEVLLAAARLAEPHCCAVDLNLGCPQRIAHSGHFGSYLLGEVDRPLVLSIVERLARGLRVPVFCKIRLLDELDDTIAFCQQLVRAGCALIAVHARYRGSATRRRDGPAHLQHVCAIRMALGGAVPVLANGNVRGAADVAANLAMTGADGIMSAEGLLDDPGLFGRATAQAYKERRRLTKKLREAERLEAARATRALSEDEQAKAQATAATRAALDALPSLNDALSPPAAPIAAAAAVTMPGGTISVPGRLRLALEYLDLVDECDARQAVCGSWGCPAPPLPIACVIFHTRRMCRELLPKYQALAPLLGAKSTPEVRAILQRCQAYEEGRETFVADAGAARREQEAAERRRREMAKRGEFERRMRRKAAREGKPADHFLKHGLEPPTRTDVGTVRALGTTERLVWWKERFGQHCLAFHLDGACGRERGCAFLHLEAAAEELEEENPSWLEEDLETRM